MRGGAEVKLTLQVFGTALVTALIFVLILRLPVTQRAARVRLPVAIPARGPSATAATLAPIRAELALCRDRTENLRHTLETLIKVWPGRAALPEAPAGWPAWPKPGIAHEWRKGGWETSGAE